jgi:TetR/AcrR family transcriptional regulator, cholesterol catabolism regulator
VVEERILTGSEELFFKYGIRSVSMDDIARHLGISKKTIYNFFPDKEKLVNLIMARNIAKDKEAFKQISSSAPNIVEEFFQYMKHLSGMFSKINPMVFYDLQKYHPETWKLFKEFKENFILKMVEDTLQKGISQGLVRSEINTLVLSRLRIEQIEWGFNPEMFPPGQFSPFEVQLSIMEHFLYGICTLKGHKLINKLKQITEEE